MWIFFVCVDVFLKIKIAKLHIIILSAKFFNNKIDERL